MIKKGDTVEIVKSKCGGLGRSCEGYIGEVLGIVEGSVRIDVPKAYCLFGDGPCRLYMDWVVLQDEESESFEIEL